MLGLDRAEQLGGEESGRLECLFFSTFPCSLSPTFFSNLEVVAEAPHQPTASDNHLSQPHKWASWD